MPSDWNESQQAYFDATADEYGDNFEQANPYFDFVSRRYLGAVAPRPGERLLELGTSGGRFTVPLLQAGCSVTGVDLSARSLAFLEKRLAGNPLLGKLRLLADDAAVLGKLDGGGFDAVAGAHILHHVSDVPAVLRQAFSRLRSGGRAVFLEPNPLNPLWYVHITVHPGKSWRVEKGLFGVWPWRIRKAFLDAGFKSCRVEPFGFFPPQVFERVAATERWEGSVERLPGLRPWLTLNLFVAEKG